MPDILLIQPPIRDFYLTAKRTVPYGLACIASALMREGFSVAILDALATGKSKKLDLPEEMSYLRDFYSGPDISPFSLFHDFRHYGLDFESIGRLAAKSGAFLIGISSLFTAYGEEALKTAETVRLHCPRALIVLGGHHPTEMPAEVLGHGFVDFIIRGEGEVGLPRLARAVLAGASPEDVPGIGFRTPGGSLFVSAPAVMKSLDDAPLPAIELIESAYYRRGKNPCTVIIASRGCPMSCSYCSVGGAAWSRFRLKSVRSVMEELERAVCTAGARFIDFEDENISFDRKWFLLLLNEIRKRFSGWGLELRAMNGLFPPTLDDEVVCAMKEAGFSALNLSLGTTCNAQLARFRRPDVSAAFEEAVRLAGKYGMDAVGYIIAGAPGQTAQSSLEDLLYLARQQVLAGVSVFYPAPGSADFERCRKEGLLPASFSLMRATALPISDTTTRLESASLLRLGRILNFIKSLGRGEMKDLLDLTAENRADPVSCKNKPGATHVEIIHKLEKLLPGAAPGPKTGQGRAGETRREIGKLLLALFLEDGIIRGITPKGHIFAHTTSRDLCLRFSESIRENLQ